MTVHFKDVGRDKKAWSETMPIVTVAKLESSVRKSGALMSKGIDCEIDDNNMTGSIWVGDVRKVGSFAIEP